MSQILKNPEMTGELIGYLEDQINKGYAWVVYDTDNPIAGKFDLQCFLDEREALVCAKENQQIFNWFEADSIRNLIFNLKEIEKNLMKMPEKIEVSNFTSKTTNIMNLNNLEDRLEDAKELGFSAKTIQQIKENIELGVPEFKAYDHMPATSKGQIDYTLHFKKSSQSDFYYFNKFEAVHNKVEPLDVGQKYMVITKGDDGKNMVKGLDNVNEAIDLFKKQQGNAELAIGKDAAHKTMVANMENGKVNFVAKTFQSSFYANPIPQTFYVEEARGFNKEQAGNLIQGRAVYRDDMLNIQGVTYKAWIMLNTDKPRDRYNNLTTRIFHDPSYGFDLKEAFKPYNIKELENPDKAEKFYARIENGNRVLTEAKKSDGKDVKVFIEAAVRFRKANFFLENGKPEKREEFLKPEFKAEQNNNIRQQNSHERSASLAR